MANVKVLDVTLRDGGYRNNFDFTDDQARVITTGLADAGVDLCEIGYCKGSFSPRPGMVLPAMWARVISRRSGRRHAVE